MWRVGSIYRRHHRRGERGERRGRRANVPPVPPLSGAMVPPACLETYLVGRVRGPVPEGLAGKRQSELCNLGLQRAGQPLAFERTSRRTYGVRILSGAKRMDQSRRKMSLRLHRYGPGFRIAGSTASLRGLRRSWNTGSVLGSVRSGIRLPGSWRQRNGPVVRTRSRGVRIFTCRRMRRCWG